MSRKTPEGRNALIAQLKKEGKTNREIALIVGRSLQRIGQILKSMAQE